MGMFVDCQSELIRALKAAGCEKEPFTSKKRMLLSSESRISAVLCEEDMVERAKEKRYYAAAEGRNKKRSKLYNRDITFTVVIADYNQEATEETYEKFLLEVASGIYTDGNYVSIEPADAQWMGEKDHILKAKIAVQLKIVCHGGLYKDTDMVPLKDIHVDVEKEG